MDTNTTLLDVNAETPLRQSFERTQAARTALPLESLVAMNVDVRRAATIATNGLASAEPLLEGIETRLPATDVALLRSLRERAEAVIYAQTLVDSDEKSSEAIVALQNEALETRERLLADLNVAARRGLVSAKHFADLTHDVGYRNVASDLGVLVKVARSAMSSLAGRSAITTDEVDRAEKLVAALWHAIGNHERKKPAGSTSASERQRAMTLLANAYDALQRVVAYLRWDEGDADAIVPALYAAPRARPKKDRGEPASGVPSQGAADAPSGAPVASSVTSPSASVVTTAPRVSGPPPFGEANAPGAPRLNPFVG